MRARAAGALLVAIALSIVGCAEGPIASVSTPGATSAPPTWAPVATPPTPVPTLAVLPTHVPTAPPDPGFAVARHAIAFSDALRPATASIPREAPETRRADESLDDYAARAQAAARAGAGALREIVAREWQWMEHLDLSGCPMAAEYRVTVEAYSVVVSVVWAALYAPDAALLRQGLADLDVLNASLAAGAAKLEGASSPCHIRIETGVAVLATKVVGTQSTDITRSLSRVHESALGNLVADAMRWKYRKVDAALLNSGSLRADLLLPPSADEQPGEITWGELVGVLPFADRTAILTLTGRQLRAALRNGFAPACDPAFAGGTGRFPQLSGLRARFHCSGTAPVIDGVWRTSDRGVRSAIKVRPADKVRLVTVDYLVAGGDGYAFSTHHVVEPGDTLLDLVMDYLAARSPVAPTIENRIVGP